MRDRKGTWMLVAASALLAMVPAASGSAQATGSDSSRARGTATAGSLSAAGDQTNSQQCVGLVGAGSGMAARGDMGAMRSPASPDAGTSGTSGQNRAGSQLPSGMTDANILAHLAMGDSLEIQLSQCELSRAQNAQVRDFAQTLISDHTTSLQQGRTVAQQAGITPQLAAGDTMMSRMRLMSGRANPGTGSTSGMARGNRANAGRDSAGGRTSANQTTGTTGTPSTSSAAGARGSAGNANARSNSSNGSWAGSSDGAMSDRGFIRQQVALHQRMINELQSLRSSAQNSAVRQHIDTVLPVMQRHLSRARELQQSLGGGNTQGSGASRQP
jgi:predicted outer membrane protein